SSTITPGPLPAPVPPSSSSFSAVSPSCCSPCLECPGTHGSPAWMLSPSTNPPAALATLRLSSPGSGVLAWNLPERRR
nr:voltage-dependent calcium channel protein type L - human [Homo sapiens]